MLCTAGLGEEKKVEPDPVLGKLKGKIEPEAAKLDPNPTFEIPESSVGRSHVVRYKTRQYVIHATNKVFGEKVTTMFGGDKMKKTHLCFLLVLFICIVSLLALAYSVKAKRELRE